MDSADLADLEIENRIQVTLARRHARSRNTAAPGASRCVECDNPIPAERRRALPETATCVHCAEAQERVSCAMGRNAGTWWW